MQYVGEEVTRVVCASQATINGSVYSEMERIRASAVRNNEPVGVATALLYQSGWFVQWKEGPVAALRRILPRVAQDARHRSLRIVHRSQGPRLLDGPWSMAIVQCGDSAQDMERRVEQLERATDAGVRFLPPAVWRRLSTPLEHPGAASQQDPEAFQRVLVCAAGGVASFDLVAWLARARKEEVVRRRFAGARCLDVATDYVDFAAGDRVLRVIAMARKGLALPLTRAFVPDYSHLVLLLGGDAQRDCALVERIAKACARAPEAPVLIGVAAAAEHHRLPAELASCHALPYLRAQADPADPAGCWAAVEPLLKQPQ